VRLQAINMRTRMSSNVSRGGCTSLNTATMCSLIGEGTDLFGTLSTETSHKWAQYLLEGGQSLGVGAPGAEAAEVLLDDELSPAGPEGTPGGLDGPRGLLPAGCLHLLHSGGTALLHTLHAGEPLAQGRPPQTKQLSAST
jgi:hypothetical protein